MISTSAALHAVVLLIIAGLIFWLFWWLIDYCKIPEPFNRIARVILALIAVLVLVSILMSLLGYPVFVARGSAVSPQIARTPLPDSPYHIQCGPEE